MQVPSGLFETCTLGFLPLRNQPPWWEKPKPHGKGTCGHCGQQLGQVFEASQPRRQTCERRSLPMSPAPSCWVMASCRRPPSCGPRHHRAEITQAIPATPCPNSWSTESISIRRCLLFSAMISGWFVTQQEISRRVGKQKQDQGSELQLPIARLEGWSKEKKKTASRAQEELTFEC